MGERIKKIQTYLDRIALFVSSIMLGLMMLILILNIILRYLPGVGGVKWYMESTQYLNVWSMLVVGISISIKNEHLNVNLLESMLPIAGRKVLKIINSLLIAVFYLILAYGTFLLASKSRQEISTMPMFRMSLVYWLIPITSVLSSIAAIIGLVIDLENIDLTAGGGLQ